MDLKSCPFCGSDDVGVYVSSAYVNGKNPHTARCNVCFATADYELSMEEAIEAWNRRALDTEVERKLKEYETIIKKFGSFERAMTAENVTRCQNCYHYDSDNLLCHYWGRTEPTLMLDQGYCSCGVDRETMEKMLESCRANGGWCTPGVIITADECKRLLNKETCNEETV